MNESTIFISVICFLQAEMAVFARKEKERI